MLLVWTPWLKVKWLNGLISSLLIQWTQRRRCCMMISDVSDQDNTQCSTKGRKKQRWMDVFWQDFFPCCFFSSSMSLSPLELFSYHAGSWNAIAINGGWGHIHQGSIQSNSSFKAGAVCRDSIQIWADLRKVDLGISISSLCARNDNTKIFPKSFYLALFDVTLF